MADQSSADTDILLRFVHVSDTHIAPDPNYNSEKAPYVPAVGASALVQAVNSLPFTPDFILHTGDVAYDPDPAAYTLAHEILSAFCAPVYYLAGNHDDPAALQRALLPSQPLLDPFEYEFEVNGVQIVTIDSNGPAEAPAGAIRPEQFERLHRLFEADDPRPLIVAVHHNVLPVGVPWWDSFMRLQNGADLHRALLPARHRLRGVFHGHTHQNTDTLQDGILYAGVTGSWYQIHTLPGQTETDEDPEIPPGFNVVTVLRDRTFIRRHHFTVER